MSCDVSEAKRLFSHVYDGFLDTHWRGRDSRLHQAIRYCLEGEGKRVRAMMSMLVCEAYGKNMRHALSSSVAVEMVHAYSLAHDDLPCMDNDSLRRGRPALHVAFDECTALLAGDAILADAMRVLVDEQFFPDAAFVSMSGRARLIKELASAAGGNGMVFGQDQDMFWTGRKDVDLPTLESIHRLKTGAIIGAACAMGAISAEAGDSDISKWREFGAVVGLAFQAIDDALDASEFIGKTPNKDVEQQKLTYMALFARDDVLKMAAEKTSSAIHLIPGNIRANRLNDFIKALLSRQI